MLKVLIVDDEAVVRRGIVLGIDWASLGCAVVGEAAGMVGYRDVAYFGSTFKKLTGLSPSEYQDRCR